MAQYNQQTKNFLTNNNTLYEVVMLADEFGNPVTGGNATGAAVDAFGRARMSQPITLFDSKNIDGLSSEFYNVTSGTGASVVYDNYYNAASMGISSAAEPQHVIRRSKRRMSYQPGKSLLIMATFTMSPAQTGLNQKAGYYDDNNGIYIEKDGHTYNLVLRTSTGFTQTIPQSEWNGDRLNGISSNNPSGYVLDLDYSQIFWTDVEWLGVGSVRCGFVINGQMIVAHTFHHANSIVGTYMKTANLPVTYEIETDETYAGGAASMKQICATVISEGGYESRGTPYVVGTPIGGTSTTSTNWMNLVSIKLNNLNAIAVLSGADVLNISNSDFEWAIFRNSTFATDLVYPNVVNGVAWDSTASELSSVGTRIAGGYLGGKTAPISFGSSSWEYQLGATASVSDTFTLAIRGTQSKSAAGIIKWIEH